MSHHHEPVIDTRTLRAAGLLVAISLVGAGYARITGDATVIDSRSGAVQVQALHFVDREDGAVVVRDGERTVGIFESGEGGFARGALRALARQRRLAGEGADAPFELVRWADGRVSLEDPVTGQTIVLNAFGPDNLRPFAELLGAGDEATASVAAVATTENDA